MVRVLGIVPARSGSKRLVGKNLRTLAGKPLVCHAIEAALAAKSLEGVILSSDAPDILACADAYAGVRALERPAELSTDEAPAIGYVLHALQHCRFTPDAVAIIQPSSPFTQGEDIDATVEALFALGALSSASVCEVRHDLHPSKFKVLDQGMLKPYFEEEGNRRAHHELRTAYVRNGSVYVSTIAAIKCGNLLEEPCAAYLMPNERSLDINSVQDLRFAEFLMQNQQR
ncbi:MAG: acylneuraminate cytidylyltransferase family protein [Saprospiraceae bacterium]|jgi:CMP-N,N'-diacetyllegionaminic acid synthase|nr:acylneuraminate cytidylyltransferase family protein [Saprospiraceae bacterium]MBP9210559.1 acylneuraminate cytidylyltransferase family protein [Saprospiraceae bacterium]MBV6473307.1 CMP-N,N'-diacetyllegionaminic acid synthase [Saprospiraceae bacterium]